MKKILLSLACFCFLTSYSQDLHKGDKLFGGSFSFTIFNSNPNGPSYNSGGNAGILPSFSWIVKDNLAMGVRTNLGFNKNVQKYDNGDKNTNQSLNLGVGLFLKKYRSLKDKFGVYFDNEISGNYNVNKTKTSNIPEGTSKYYGATYRFSPGVFYRFSNHFMGEGNIGGAFASYYGGGGYRNWGIGLSFLQYFNLGINYKIEGKKKV